MVLSFPRVPETNKRPGVHYALTDDGIELPVIDVTHPAFGFEPGDAELAGRIAAFVRASRRRERVPAFLLRPLFRVLLRRSVLARGLMAADGAFLAGLPTYLFKLGPDLLGSGYAQPIDRRIADALSALSMRLRLLDMARLLVAGTTAALASRRGALHLVNLGGGPSSDSWNALLLLRRERPELLEGRPLRIHALDPDHAGPAFGARALAALQGAGAPLRGLDLTLARAPYDWARPETLRAVVGALEGEAPIVAISSEGALFEYAGDADVAANLEVLREVAPADAVVVGSTTSDDDVARMMQRESRVPLRPRSVAAFTALVEGAGWKVARIIPRPACRDVLLVKA